MAQGDNQIYFPEDVREDVAIFGNVTLLRAVIFLVIPILLGVLFFLFLPLSTGIRLTSLFFFPAVGGITVLMDIPGRLRRYKRYLKEPGRRKSGPPEEKGSLQEMIGAAFLSGPYLHYKDGSAAVFLKVAPPPWEYQTDTKKIEQENTFAASVTRAISYGLEVTEYADVDRDLCREEWDLREAQYSQLEDGGLKDLGLARVRHHRDYALARKTEYHIRLRAIPGMVDLQRRPADAEERRRLTEEALQDAAGGIIMELSRADMSVSVLGAESIRNLAVKQINPAAWRRVLPPLETDWTTPAAYQVEISEETDSSINPEKPKRLEKIHKLLSRPKRRDRVAHAPQPGVALVPGKLDRPAKFRPGKIANMISTLFKRRSKKPARGGELLGNLIAVWSPVPAGKTFTAVNLAVSLAWKGHNVILLDLDIRQLAVNSWFNIEGAGGLKQFLANPGADPWSIGFMPREVPGLLVLTHSGRDQLAVNESVLINLLTVLSRHAGYVIVDTGATGNETQAVLNLASKVLLVADQEPHRLDSISNALDSLESILDMNKLYLVANRIIESHNLDAESSVEDIRSRLGIGVDYRVPEQTTEAMEGMSSGVPPALFSREISKAFREISLDMAS